MLKPFTIGKPRLSGNGCTGAYDGVAQRPSSSLSEKAETATFVATNIRTGRKKNDGKPVSVNAPRSRSQISDMEYRILEKALRAV